MSNEWGQALSPRDRRLITEIQDGLPLVRRPYASIGARLGISEVEVLRTLERLLANGTIRRLGVVVRHHELGYRANAMVVWDVADGQVNALGQRLRAFPFVTLCYRRPRRLPDWPYNLFCMIHGRCKDEVNEQIEQLIVDLNLQQVPRAVLFSGRRFKQRGAHYMPETRQVA